MALAHLSFFSDILGLSTSMTVIVPQSTSAQIGMSGRATSDPPVLYLLHGLSDDETIWLRRTSIERYVADRGIAVVMPRVDRSFYCDMARGPAYWTFVSEELPAVVGHFFRFATTRERTYAAGLSMGGYGALKLGLRQPDRFAAVASLSGAVDFASRLDEADSGGVPGEIQRNITDGRDTAADDLFGLAERADPARLPRILLTCGKSDELLDENKRFASACAKRGIKVTTEWTKGGHTWDVWDRDIQRFLDWI